MVLQKKIYYGFHGYQVLPIPRATRSARKKGCVWKKIHDTDMCAFDLLATVAGKLLSERECSSGSPDTISGIEHGLVREDSVMIESGIEKGLEVKPFDQEISNGNAVASEPVSQVPCMDHCSKEFTIVQNGCSSGLASNMTASDGLENAISSGKMVKVETKIELGCSASNVDVGSSSDGVAYVCRIEDESVNHKKNEPPNNRKTSAHGVDLCSSRDEVAVDRKFSAVAGLENSISLPFFSGEIACGPCPEYKDDVKLVVKDDDQKISGCTQPSTENKAYKPSPRIGDRRIRKLLASKYWKLTSKPKVEEHFNIGAEIRPVYHNRKFFYKGQRYQRDYPFKKRKLYRYSALSNSGGGISGDGVSSSSWKSVNEDVYRSGNEVNAALGAVTGTSASGPGQNCLQSRDSSVKLKIRSFRVPELLIEIPKTATVGSLKRAVVEAMTSILGGGLRVGVLLQGKNIRDDHKTLQQTGISCDDKLESLGFTLEPNPSQAPPPLGPEYCPYLLSSDVSKQVVRCPARSAVQKGTPDPSTDPKMTNVDNLIECNHDPVPSPPEISIGKVAVDSRALVAVPAMKVEALSVVPTRKSKRSEVVQRRIRRPFSVSEVEALVQAVEKLGTGRWRDVKLRAFDHAKHRTYVDLKDKWKTLVHTARISPQQRRGEPVPQELLDRVLTAHAYWSQHQSKKQHKLQQPETRLLL